jgi:act minimal PKS acyl carrier protein
MRECAGADESAQSLEEAPEEPFANLGFDSIALLETQSRIKRDYGVEFSEDDLGRITTPREFVEFCNSLLPAAQSDQRHRLARWAAVDRRLPMQVSLCGPHLSGQAYAPDHPDKHY